MRLPRTAPLGALLALSLAVTLTNCGSSDQHADDDEDPSAGSPGGAGEGGDRGDGGDSSVGGEDSGSGGEAGAGASGGGGTSGNAGSGGTSGAGGSSGRDGSAGRGGGSAGMGGGVGGNGGGTSGMGGDAGTGVSAGTAGTGAAGSAGTGGSGSGIVTFLWGDYRESLTDGTSYLFPDVNLGPGGSGRLVVVTTHAASNVIVSYDAVTIGGIAAEKVASVGEDVMPSAPTAFFVARVPTGEQADIQVDLSAGVVRAAIAVCLLGGVGSTVPFDSGSATSTDGATFPVDIPVGGVLLAALGMADVAGAQASWANVYELYDMVMVEGTPTHVSGAFRPGGSAAGAFDVTVYTPSAGYDTRAVAVSFAP